MTLKDSHLAQGALGSNREQSILYGNVNEYFFGFDMVLSDHRYTRFDRSRLVRCLDLESGRCQLRGELDRVDGKIGIIKSSQLYGHCAIFRHDLTTSDGHHDKLDGATALYPLYAAVAQAVYPDKQYDQFDSEVMASKTPEAYKNLMEGNLS